MLGRKAKMINPSALIGHIFKTRRFVRGSSVVVATIALSLAGVLNGLADCPGVELSCQQCQEYLSSCIAIMCPGKSPPPFCSIACHKTYPCTPCPGGCIASITPASGMVGDTIDVSIYGRYRRFTEPVEVRTNNPGIAVSDIKILSDTRIQATFEIDSAAPVGDFSVWLVTPGWFDSIRFTVTDDE